MTAGLKVPAASHPVPRGAITGVSDTRCHRPNGKDPLPCAASAVSRARSINILVGTKRLILYQSCRDRELLAAKNGRADPLPFSRSCVLASNYFLLTDFLSSAPGLNFATLRAAILIVA